MEPALAFNTAASFVSNTNLQHYSGETGTSYFSQLLILVFLQFVSAATGIAALALLFKGLVQKQASNLGNFYNLFLKTCTRILLPISVVIAILLLLNGCPVTFNGPQDVNTLEGKIIKAATGPVAPMIAIKQLGTNGGGFFGANSAHPFENPTPLTNFMELEAILMLAAALCYTFGKMVGKTREGWSLLGAMLIIFVPLLWLCVASEQGGNPAFAKRNFRRSAAAIVFLVQAKQPALQWPHLR